MVERRGKPVRAWLMIAGAGWVICATQAHAQQPAPIPSGELDPGAPLDPMPDLGVDWPDMTAPEPAPEPQADGAEPLPEIDTGLSDAATERSYGYRISGLDGIEGRGALLVGFEERSILHKERKDRANAAQIDRRARADADVLAELLRSQGYYDALVEPRIGGGGGRITVELAAEPGPRYRFESVDLPGLDQAAGAEAVRLREAFAVKAGDPVVAQQVIDAGVALQVALGERGFATARVGEQDIVIDHEAQVARLVLPVTPGPIARFGRVSVSGRPAFSAHHVGVIARFKAGDRYERSEVDDLRRALIATGLISSVEVTQQPRAGGEVIDLAIKLEPAPVRTIAGELGYGTGEGLRAEASWQHRNFFNPEGAVTVRAVAGTQEQAFGVSLRRNNWKRRDQVLNGQISASHLDRDAYEAKTVSLSGGFERQSNFIWQKKWTWSLGAELVASDERDTVEATGDPRQRTYLIAALPASLGYDGTDDLLDPTTGFRLSGRASPEMSFRNGAFGYGRLQVDASAYRPIRKRVVAAGRIRIGTIVGASRDDIAPSRRFYAGGGGSVRGYGYQQIGPRDVDNDPIGGRSMAEFSLEARVRLKAFGGNFGIVPFIDGGTLSTDALPEFKNWQIGVGIGARYYSSFGPIRIDVGTPINRQPGDGRIAVVVGLGQAF